MPQLKFFLTQTKVPREEVRNVVSGYTMVQNCAHHLANNTRSNPKKNFVQELIIANKKYPAALLRPWGYVATHESVLGEYPSRTIFFYKHPLSELDNIREQFDAAPEGTEFLWSCGCRIRKYTKAELEEICKEPWYPWFGDREPALFTYGHGWKSRRRTTTAQEIADALLEAGVIDDDQAKRVVEVIRSHRS